ncbi:MAG: NapC/NirT family cytochrome c [Actinobacteria bacterium]|nr:NapC/NirT family cytochrome c [Actinomycetota bacterium]
MAFDWNRIKELTTYYLKKFFPNWIHIVIKVPIIIYLLYAFINYMLFIFSTPTFCQTCHEMKVYHAQWLDSNHANVGCYDCHGHKTFFSKIFAKVESLSELYHHLTGTFEVPIAPKKFSSDHNCKYCHPNDVKRVLPGDLIDPHKKHEEVHVEGKLAVMLNGTEKKELEFNGQHCVYCHLNVVHADKKEDRRPQMEFCMQNCHNGKKATDECSACHTDKPLPESHKAANWYEIHGAMAKKEDCRKCHAYTENFCQECHKNRPKSHDKSWKSTHKFKAKADRQNCYACHKDEYCLNCHGIVPK